MRLTGQITAKLKPTLTLSVQGFAGDLSNKDFLIDPGAILSLFYLLSRLLCLVGLLLSMRKSHRQMERASILICTQAS